MSLTGTDGCTSKQTFCEIACETVGDMLEKDNVFNTEVISFFPNFSKGQIIPPELYNNVKILLTKISQYGNEGTSNPIEEDINEINNVNKNDIIYFNNYNKILQILNKENLLSSGTNLISKQLINDLQTYIREYKFNDDRCNYCNSGCNSSNSGGGGDSCACWGDCPKINSGAGDDCLSSCETHNPSVSGCEISGDSYGPCWATGNS